MDPMDVEIASTTDAAGTGLVLAPAPAATTEPSNADIFRLLPGVRYVRRLTVAVWRAVNMCAHEQERPPARSCLSQGGSVSRGVPRPPSSP